MLLDAHCHLTGNYQKELDVESLLRRAEIAGVSGLIAVGTDLDDSRNVLKLAASHDNIRASLGVHPHEAKLWDSNTEQALTELLKSPQVLFVGETGLDWHYDLSPRDQQELVFRAHIRLAKKLNKPLMIHTRSAPDATLRILVEENAFQVGGIIHCFSENPPFAKRAIELNFYISFSGILTFPKKCEAIRETAVWVPEDRIFVETDSPFLAPIPYRGKPCEPAYVTHTAKCLAELRGCDVKHIHRVTANNMETLCGWRP